MNNPFCYEPHPLCLEAADEVRRYLSQQPEWDEEVAAGKMFGVLVCEDEKGTLGFLAAYSGQIQGRADWPWFVPAVFDYLQPDGYFRQEEARISAINHRIDTLESDGDLEQLKQKRQAVEAEATTDITAYKTAMDQAKQRRDDLRNSGQPYDEEQLVRENQFQKAELRRKKHYWAGQLAEVDAQMQPISSQVAALRRERHERSDALQRWLFDHFLMLNSRGEQRSLTSIFADTPQGVPPSGSGECWHLNCYSMPMPIICVPGASPSSGRVARHAWRYAIIISSIPPAEASASPSWNG